MRDLCRKTLHSDSFCMCRILNESWRLRKTRTAKETKNIKLYSIPNSTQSHDVFEKRKRQNKLKTSICTAFQTRIILEQIKPILPLITRPSSFVLLPFLRRPSSPLFTKEFLLHLSVPKTVSSLTQQYSKIDSFVSEWDQSCHSSCDHRLFHFCHSLCDQAFHHSHQCNPL